LISREARVDPCDRRARAASRYARGVTARATTCLVFALVALALASGCRAADTVSASIGDDSWVTLAPSPWQVRLGKLAPGDFEDPKALVVVKKKTEEPVGAGARGRGTTIPIVDGDRRCALRVDDTYAYTEPTAPVGMKNPRPADLRPRTYTGVSVTVACADGPVPGTEASHRGSRALQFAPWFALFLLAAAFAARLAHGDRVNVAVGIVLASIMMLFAAGLGAIRPPYAITSMLALAGAFVLGWIAGAASIERRAVAIAAGLAAASAVVALGVRYPRWSLFAPLGALGLAAAAMLVVLVVGVLVQDEPATRLARRRARRGAG
jgi:hypothetical protein